MTDLGLQILLFRFVVLRPGLENVVIHYLETGLIWNGCHPLDISCSLYLPIVEEIAEAEQRTDNSLPGWKKVGLSCAPEED